MAEQTDKERFMALMKDFGLHVNEDVSDTFTVPDPTDLSTKIPAPYELAVTKRDANGQRNPRVSGPWALGNSFYFDADGKFISMQIDY